MNAAAIQLALALIEKILVYGAPSVIAALQAWDIQNPTAEDIRKLEIVKNPEEYFK